ncbi:MAG: alpha/beta fold hydrolase [Methylotetracoccus sp.]
MTGTVEPPPDPGGPLPEGWQHRWCEVDAVRLHFVEAGTGPLVVLLHGFPEFWYSWRRQIGLLVAAGRRVVALDQRGYNLSEKPAGVHAYRVERLVDDVAGLILALGESAADVVGHDWGGAIAWMLAIRHPQRVRRLAVLNGPHPRRMAEELRLPRQLRRSWYMFLFQLPWLPEWLLARDRYRGLLATMSRDVVTVGAFSDADLAAYRAAIAMPGALTSAVNYYRALFRRNPFALLRQVGRIDHPTLLIWGERDRYLGLPLTEGLSRWVADLRVERIPEASHWVQVDVPDRVNALLIEFFQMASRAAVTGHDS